jgi:alpha-glucosidase
MPAENTIVENPVRPQASAGVPRFGRLVLRIALIIAGGVSLAKAESWSVTSPNGLVKVTVQLADLGGRADYPQGRARLYYRVEQGAEGQRGVVIGDSPLGLMLRGEDFVDGLRLDSAQAPKLIEESYTTVHGKRRNCANRANHQTIAFRNGSGKAMELDVRAYDDGAAFRYRLPGMAEEMVLEREVTGFGVPADARLWMAPSDKADTYSPAYETYYENEIAAGTPSTTGMAGRSPCSSGPATRSVGR